MKRKMSKGKKVMSLVVALCMVISIVSVAAFAANDSNTSQVEPLATVEVPSGVKEFAEEWFGSTEAFADFVAGTVGQIVTGTKSDHLAEVIVRAFEEGIIIGNISTMTDEEVEVMLDQIYWVYADNPGPITQTVDCIKMFVNWCDAAIHFGQDGVLLGTMQKKLATYYWNWLKEHCVPGLGPDEPVEPTDPSEPTEAPTDEPTSEPATEPTTEPTSEPATEPTTEPTSEPTTEPATEPTEAPTDEPTAAPTDEPTAAPTDEPTAAPTDEPTAAPTDEPTAAPTDEPVVNPTDEPAQTDEAPAGEQPTAQEESPDTGDSTAVSALVLVSAAAAAAFVLTCKKGKSDKA